MPNVPVKDFSRGLDNFSARSNIKEGYSESLLNVDVSPAGYIETRKGYQGYYGHLPVRVVSVEHDGTDIIFTLDSSIDLTTVVKGPLVVYGKLSSAQTDGDFTNTPTGVYYPAWTIGGSNNKLVVADITEDEADYTDSSPQLTIWGLGAIAGYAQHVDVFRRPLEERVIAGAGGHFYAARTRAEISSAYLLGDSVPAQALPITTASKVGPAFDITGSTADGPILFDSSIVNNAAKVVRAYYADVDGAGIMRVDLEFTNATGSVLGLAGQTCTLSGLPYSALNGTFTVFASLGATSPTGATLRIVNPAVTDGRYDCDNCEGRLSSPAGVITTSGQQRARVGVRAGDKLYNVAMFDGELTIGTVLSTIFVASTPAVGANLTLADTLNVRRTASVLPLDSVDNIVVGDMLTVSGLPRPVRVTFVNTLALADSDFTYVCDGTHATLTLNSPVKLNVGQTLVVATAALSATQNFIGEHVITHVLSDTQVKVAFTAAADATPRAGTLTPQTIEIDEAVTTDADTTIAVLGRWIPVEAPADSGFTAPKTLPAASAATRVRSVMAQDNMYLTSYNDDVVKFDGDSTYNAGLPRWRPQMFITLDTTVEAIPLTTPRIPILQPDSVTFTTTDVNTTYSRITVEDHGFVTGDTVRLTTAGTLPDGLLTDVTYYINRVDEDTLRLADSLANALAGNYVSLIDTGAGTSTIMRFGGSVIEVAGGASLSFGVGSTIRLSSDNSTYTVLGVTEGTTTDTLFLDKNLTDAWTSASFIQGVDVYRYYARLNAVDANNNIIASAAAGAEDMVVHLTRPGQFQFKFIGLPLFANYNYSRVELELYRTRANTVGPYYLVSRTLMPANALTPYLDITDNRPDVSLFEQDKVNTALLGAELGTTWDKPAQAKYTTTADGRLVLANIKDKDRSVMTLKAAPSATALTYADFSGVSVEVTDGDTRSLTYEFTHAVEAITDLQAYDGESFLIDAAAGIAPGHWVYLHGSASPKYSGWFRCEALIGTDFFLNPKWAQLRGALLPPVVSFDNDTDVNTTDNTITILGHGMSTGEQIFFASYDADGTDVDAGVPAGLSYTNYIIAVDADTVKFAASYEEALAGTALDISAIGTGIGWFSRYNRSDRPSRAAIGSSPDTVPVLSYGLSALADDSNFNAAPSMYPRVGESWERVAALRLAMAINATQASISSPWCIAEAGGEYDAGECTIVAAQPGVGVTVEWNNIPNNIHIYVDNVLRGAGELVSGATRVFPSRLVASYPNFPEIFDNPYGTPQTSDSAIDVGAADGQEITGVMPFFGASTSGGAQLGSTVVVFKTASIYLVDVASKQVQRIPGNLGCTAPHSIVATPSGIMFANESGIYILTQDMKVRPAGRMIQTFWRERVSKAALSEAYGTYYALRRQYKLSVPVDGSATNNYVLVYNQEKEGDGQEYGAWTFYDNHPATGWANLSDDAVFSTTDGQVFSLRKLEEASDYRDDGDAISSQEIILRAEDFGAPGLRKRIRNFFLELDGSLTGLTNLVVKLAADLSSTFEEAGTIGELGSEEGLRFASPASKAKYVQLKISHSGKDKCLLLTGVSYNVDGLSAKGTKEQADV